MSTQQTVFLDTSLQIQRTLGEPPEANRLNALLAAPTIRPLTSTYVWMEYQRTVVADFAHVYRLMWQYSDWGSLFRHILDGERAFRPRSAVRCTKIVGKFYAECEQNWETAKYAIDEQIRVGLRQRFWRDTLSLPDPIVCDLVTNGSVHQPDGTYTVAASCRKEQAACHLPAFLAEHQSKLHTIVDYLATHPHTIKDQVRLERLVTATLADPRTALGQASCWPLGDLIIALQVPTGAALWTLDADFSALATALNIPLYTA